MNQKKDDYIYSQKSKEIGYAKESLFTTPIWVAQDPKWVDSLNKASDPVIQNIKDKIKKEGKPRPNSYHSNNLWQNKEFLPFSKFVLQESWNILSTWGYTLEGHSPLMRELWVQEFPKEGGFHDIHIHSNNHISGFYFLECDSTTSKPSFHDPRPGKLMMDCSQQDEKKITLATHQINWNVKPGTLIFFPSFLPHSYGHYSNVKNKKGNYKFRFIHFNTQIVVKDNITNAAI